MDSQTGATVAPGAKQNGEDEGRKGERAKMESSPPPSSNNGFADVGSNSAPNSFSEKGGHAGGKSKSTQDANHNTTVAVGGASVEAAAAIEDAAMASEGDSDSMREFHHG